MPSYNFRSTRIATVLLKLLFAGVSQALFAQGDVFPLVASTPGTLQQAIFSPDGSMIVSTSNNGICTVWDVKSGAIVQTLTPANAKTYFLPAVFSIDNEKVLTGALDSVVQLWDIKTGAEIRRYEGSTKGIFRVEFNHDGTRIAASSDDGNARIWDAATGALLHTLKGHTGPVFTASFSPDGTRLATSGRDTTIRIWDVETGQQIEVFRSVPRFVRDLNFSPDGQNLVAATLVISGSTPSKVIMLNAQTGVIQQEFDSGLGSVNTAVFSRNGKRLLTCGPQSYVRVWDVKTGTIITQWSEQKDYASFARFSPDEKLIAVNGQDTIYLWTTPSSADVNSKERIVTGKEPSIMCHPNPMQTTMQVEYQVPFSTHVTLSIFDAMGRRKIVLVDERQSEGSHSILVDTHDLISGIYFCLLQPTGGKATSTKITVEK